MHSDDSAPVTGCDCTVCRTLRRNFDLALGYQSDGSAAFDADLEANYQRYLAGELVAKDAKE